MKKQHMVSLFTVYYIDENGRKVWEKVYDANVDLKTGELLYFKNLIPESNRTEKFWDKVHQKGKLLAKKLSKGKESILFDETKTWKIEKNYA